MRVELGRLREENNEFKKFIEEIKEEGWSFVNRTNEIVLIRIISELTFSFRLKRE